MKRVHFIAIGGAAMHNLAIALQELGYQVSGSDDEIREPSRSRLKRKGLLPKEMGWYPQDIKKNIDNIILGMHARPNNPELLKAQELGIPVMSYPEFLFEQTKNKKRFVVGGSHGKTSITSMIMHVLKDQNIDFDYMVGAQIEGFETMVRLSNTADIAIFEGDEYLSSPIDLRPKFHLYKPHVSIISGIAWDHINVFPTFENYVQQFEIFANQTQDNIILYAGDANLKEIGQAIINKKVNYYTEIEHKVQNGRTIIIDSVGQEYNIPIFGKHNMQNLEASKRMCIEMGVSEQQFFQSITTFKGAARRLEVLKQTSNTTIFRDFAHSPSKLKATTKAVKEQFASRKLVACMELHTFSSLKKDFLPQYKQAMKDADIAYVYFDKATVAHKQLEEITEQDVLDGFAQENLKVFTNSDKMFAELADINWNNKNLLLMSSGTFSGVDIEKFAQELLQ